MFGSGSFYEANVEIGHGSVLDMDWCGRPHGPAVFFILFGLVFCRGLSYTSVSSVVVDASSCRVCNIDLHLALTCLHSSYVPGTTWLSSSAAAPRVRFLIWFFLEHCPHRS